MIILQNSIVDHLYTEKVHLQSKRIGYLSIFLRLL